MKKTSFDKLLSYTADDMIKMKRKWELKELSKSLFWDKILFSKKKRLTKK